MGTSGVFSTPHQHLHATSATGNPTQDAAFPPHPSRPRGSRPVAGPVPSGAAAALHAQVEIQWSDFQERRQGVYASLAAKQEALETVPQNLADRLAWIRHLCGWDWIREALTLIALPADAPVALSSVANFKPCQGCKHPSLLGLLPDSLNKSGAGVNVSLFAPNRHPRSAPGPSH